VWASKQPNMEYIWAFQYHYMYHLNLAVNIAQIPQTRSAYCELWTLDCTSHHSLMIAVVDDDVASTRLLCHLLHTSMAHLFVRVCETKTKNKHKKIEINFEKSIFFIHHSLYSFSYFLGLGWFRSTYTANCHATNYQNWWNNNASSEH
jgi:hypothetical protein